jgi:hypothetical protein
MFNFFPQIQMQYIKKLCCPFSFYVPLTNYCDWKTEAVWISISADLIDDARRDLSDIGASRIHVHDLRNFKNVSKLSAIDKLNEGVRMNPDETII